MTFMDERWNISRGEKSRRFDWCFDILHVWLMPQCRIRDLFFIKALLLHNWHKMKVKSISFQNEAEKVSEFISLSIKQNVVIHWHVSIPAVFFSFTSWLIMLILMEQSAEQTWQVFVRTGSDFFKEERPIKPTPSFILQSCWLTICFFYDSLRADPNSFLLLHLTLQTVMETSCLWIQTSLSLDDIINRWQTARVSMELPALKYTEHQF